MTPDTAPLHALILALSEKLWQTSQHLSMLAEREEVRGKNLVARNSMTARSTILLALYRASGGDLDARFMEADIVVLTFRIDPDKFSMRGYPQWPDAKRISSDLTKLKAAGLIEILGTKVYTPKNCRPSRPYRLTAAGIEQARLLEGKK